MFFSFFLFGTYLLEDRFNPTKANNNNKLYIDLFWDCFVFLMLLHHVGIKYLATWHRAVFIEYVGQDSTNRRVLDGSQHTCNNTKYIKSLFRAYLLVFYSILLVGISIVTIT